MNTTFHTTETRAIPDGATIRIHGFPMRAELIAASPDLLAAALYAVEILGRVPAFGDTIGTEVSKAQLGVARNQLKSAIEKALA